METTGTNEPTPLAQPPAPQLTLRAVLTGGLIGMVMSLSNLYLSLKIGWAFGVAITSCVLSFVLWRGISIVAGGRIRPIGMLETNCMQSTASAAGYSTGGTVGTALGALYLIKHQHEPAWVVGCFVLLTAALGVFLAIPMKRQMINQEKLPFPDGIAAAETLRSLFSESVEAIRKAWVLIWGIVAGALIGLSQGFSSLQQNMPLGHWAQRLGDFFCRHKMSIPEEIHFPHAPLPGAAAAAKLAGFGFAPSALMIGAGMIMGLRVAISMALGSAILYFGLAPMLVEHDVANAGISGYLKAMWAPGATMVSPQRWGVWAGTAIMVFSSLTGLALQWRTVLRAFGLFKSKPGSLDDTTFSPNEVPGTWMLAGLIPISLGLMFVLYFAWQISWWMSLVAVALSFVLSLVASRATGETNITPMGAMGKVTQLLFAGLAPQNTTINLMSAGTTASASISCADLLTDLKSGYLLGANPRQQFIAQFCGIFFGTLVVVPAWYLLANVPAEEMSTKYAMVGASSWKAMAELLAKGTDQLSYGAKPFIIYGSILGIGLPLLEKFLPAARKFLPSAMGLGLGFIVSFADSFDFLLGACIAALWARLHQKTAEPYQIPLASGLVAGQGLISVLIALSVAIVGLLAK
jgi:uncharacterized oligopeptide transporter (OPT) family protein